MSFASSVAVFQAGKRWHPLTFRSGDLKKLVIFQRQGMAGVGRLQLRRREAAAGSWEWMGRVTHSQLLIPRPAPESAEAKGAKQNPSSGWRVLITMETITQCFVWGIHFHLFWLFLTYGLPWTEVNAWRTLSLPMAIAGTQQHCYPHTVEKPPQCQIVK